MFKYCSKPVKKQGQEMFHQGTRTKLEWMEIVMYRKAPFLPGRSIREVKISTGNRLIERNSTLTLVRTWVMSSVFRQ